MCCVFYSEDAARQSGDVVTQIAGMENHIYNKAETKVCSATILTFLCNSYLLTLAVHHKYL